MDSNSSTSGAAPPMMGMKEKPQCGSDGQAGEYDLGLHVLGLFLVLGFSIFGAGFPVVAKKVKWIKVPAKIFFMCKHFGTGVLIATAFVHLLPTAFGSLGNPCLPDLFTDKYPPMPGVIMMGSLFTLFVIEMWLNSKMGGHSHGGPTGFEQSTVPLSGPGPSTMPAVRPTQPPRFDSSRGEGNEKAPPYELDEIEYEKKIARKIFEENQRQQQRRFTEGNPLAGRGQDQSPPSQMPPWFVVFYEQYVRQHLEMVHLIQTQSSSPASTRPVTPLPDPVATKRISASVVPAASASVADSPYIDVETGLAVDPAVFRKMSLNITLLEGGILFHSVFVGMTVSITIEGFIILLIAILFHQMFEGLGLGSRIAAVPYPNGSIRPWVLVVAFGTTAPIGQAIGLITRSSYDPNSAFGLIIVGVFNAISAGLLIYASLVDLLAEDFLSEEANRVMTKDKRLAFFLVLAGAAGMSVVGAFA